VDRRISWWDFDNGKRIQSIRLQSKDASRSFSALEPTALPTYYEKKELGKTHSLDIPSELVKAGSFDCLIGLLRGPNAVISEAWLVEIANWTSIRRRTLLRGKKCGVSFQLAKYRSQAGSLRHDSITASAGPPLCRNPDATR
jgi:hypothetical protein